MTAIITAIVVFILKIILDTWQHYNKKKINHPFEWSVAAVWVVTASLYDNKFKFFPLDWLVVSFQLALILWMAFDSLFGLIIARDIFYLGTTSWLDRLQTKYLYLQILKYVLAVLSITFFFV